MRIPPCSTLPDHRFPLTTLVRTVGRHQHPPDRFRRRDEGGPAARRRRDLRPPPGLDALPGLLRAAEPAQAVAGRRALCLAASPSGFSSPPAMAICRSGSAVPRPAARSEEHTSELQSLMRISYAVFCLTQKTITNKT